jgi:membrane-associated phospholipid phosphatase
MSLRTRAATVGRAVGRDLRHAIGPHGAWRSPTSGVVLLTAFAVFTLLSIGPLIELDRALNLKFAQDWPEGRPVASMLVRLGQRAVGLPVLIAVTVYVAHRRRTWAPVVISVLSVLALNFIVGLIKLATGRGSPRDTSDPSFWEGGILYPSGHTANTILVYGLAAYLAQHYLGMRSRLARLMVVLTWIAAVTVSVGITYLGGHWFTDLIAGLLIGGVVLRVTMSVHRRFLHWRAQHRARADRPSAPRRQREEDRDDARAQQDARQHVHRAAPHPQQPRSLVGKHEPGETAQQ